MYETDKLFRLICFIAFAAIVCCMLYMTPSFLKSEFVSRTMIISLESPSVYHSYGNETLSTHDGRKNERSVVQEELSKRIAAMSKQTSRMKFVSDHTFPTDFRLHLLHQYRNPCWQEGKTVQCLPYFFIGGFPKCGTTDLFQKLLLHPEICSGRSKEPHWWTRIRYKDRQKDFVHYTNFFRKSISSIVQTVDDHRFHPLVLTEGSASTVWDNKSNEHPSYLNIHVMYSVLPQAKFVLIIRDPVARLYSDYLYFQRNGSA